MLYDCQQCGACCVDYFGTEAHIELSEEEARRMRRLALPVVVWHGQVMLGTRRHEGPGGSTCCVAFVGTLGDHCACAIHPDRPSACRAFVVGGEGCRCAREAAGLPI